MSDGFRKSTQGAQKRSPKSEGNSQKSLRTRNNTETRTQRHPVKCEVETGGTGGIPTSQVLDLTFVQLLLQLPQTPTQGSGNTTRLNIQIFSCINDRLEAIPVRSVLEQTSSVDGGATTQWLPATGAAKGLVLVFPFERRGEGGGGE